MILLSLIQVIKFLLNLTILASNAWEEKKVQGSIPPAVYSHSATIVGKNLFLFGGTDGIKYFNFVYVLDLGQKKIFNFKIT